MKPLALFAFCCSVVAAGSSKKGLRINSWGNMRHHDLPYIHPIPQPSAPPFLPVMNFNHLTSMTLTFSYSEQPSHPLMCDLWSILPVVNLGWQRVVPCWGVGVNNQPWDRSLGTYLEIKRWSQRRKVSPDMPEITRPALHSKYLGEIDCINSGVLTTVASCSGTAAQLDCVIWNASRESRKFRKWAYLKQLSYCNVRGSNKLHFKDHNSSKGSHL